MEHSRLDRKPNMAVLKRKAFRIGEPEESHSQFGMTA